MNDQQQVILYQRAGGDTTVNIRSQQGTPPVPPPRISNRRIKEPDRYGDYLMYGVQTRSCDPKIQAINSLVASDALNTMDCDMTKKLLKLF